jgi:hypothetical protein
MLVFDRGGQLLASWGDGLFTNPHGVAIGFDGAIYCTDNGNHTVRKCTPEGNVLHEIGIPNKPAPRASNLPFNACMHTALARNGDIFVSDGYGNARVHKYSPDEKLLLSWGDFGSEEGCFNLVHNITCDPNGWGYVADRENHRVQVFDESGSYQAQWNNLHRRCGLCTEYRKEPLSYIGEIGPAIAGLTHDCQAGTPSQHRGPPGKARGAARRFRRRRKARPVPLAARHRGRLARRYLRRGDFHCRMGDAISGCEAGAQSSHAQEARQG